MGREYIDLLCSLPHLADPFVHRRPPISGVQLTKRLDMLDFEDRALVSDLAKSFYWGDIPFDTSDERLVQRASRAIDAVQYEDLSEWLFWRMDLRTVIAALRRRHRGEDAPVGQRWGFGRYTRYLERNWAQPHFRLEGHFTWLPEARTLLESGESYELERLLLSAAWHYYTSQVPLQPYSISEVWLYLMRWDLVERWCSYDARQAQQRFDQLVTSGLEASLQELRKIA